MSYKNSILRLRNEGKTYREIQEQLGCAKSTIAFHCATLANHQNLVQHNRNQYLRELITVPFVEIVAGLIRRGTSKKIVADALCIPYEGFVFYCKKNSLVSENRLTGYDRVRNYRRCRKILAVLYLGGSCQSCYYKRSYNALEFHHLDPEGKDFSISSNMNQSWATMKVELDKCMLLCANCHREVHDSWL